MRPSSSELTLLCNQVSVKTKMLNLKKIVLVFNKLSLVFRALTF